MPLGAACYAAAILVIERTAKMFWALAQREKERNKWREEALKEGLEQGLKQGTARGIEEGREIGREDERARIQRELAAEGIELPPEALKIIRSPHAGNGENPLHP